MVSLQRGDEVMAAPVYLPADPEIGAPEVPAVPERRAPFERNTKILLREAHPGPAWVAVAAYGGVAAVLAVWIALFAVCTWATARTQRGRAAPPGGDGFDGEAHTREWAAALHRNLDQRQPVWRT